VSGFDFFLRSSGERQFRQEVQEDFAGPADFVQPQDVEPNIDGQEISADPQIASGARSRIEQRAESGAASDDEFARAGDFDAEVGPRGVEELQITDQGARRRASRELESETDLSDVDPQQGLRQTDDGFSLSENPRRRLAAQDFEEQTELSDVDPQQGLRQTDDGFGLSQGPQRRLAADDFEDETSLSDVDPQQDLTPTDDGFSLDEDAQRRNAARNFESDLDQFGAGEIDADTLRDISLGFGLSREQSRVVAADDIDEEIDQFDIGPDDITLSENDAGEFVGEFRREVSQ
jgi:hypothetical protein